MIANYHSRARMAAVVDAIIDRLRSLPATKSINEIVGEFTNLVERLVVDAANGNIRRASFTEQMRNAIIDEGKSVYLEGMREGGIKDPDGDFDEDDQKTLDDWILSQAPHIGSFVDDAMAVNKLNGDERTAARDAMLSRAAMWAQSFESLGRMGYASAKENASGTWRLGETEQHCVTCSELNGQRHRLKWFTSRNYLPRQPGSETLSCGGWNCDCEIVDDEGNRLL